MTVAHAKRVVLGLVVAALLGVSAAPAQASTVGQQNAVRAAREYLDSQAFSLKGLISQLRFSGFTASQATYGVTHVKVNWFDESKQSARQYLQSQAFSLKGLVSQLRFSGFTLRQARYGATHSGANWYREAKASAREYLQSQAFSASGLVSQLEFSGFTPSQARYGAKAVGL